MNKCDGQMNIFDFIEDHNIIGRQAYFVEGLKIHSGIITGYSNHFSNRINVIEDDGTKWEISTKSDSFGTDKRKVIEYFHRHYRKSRYGYCYSSVGFSNRQEGSE